MRGPDAEHGFWSPLRDTVGAGSPQVLALIIDRRPAFLAGADPDLSLLTLPLGTASVLDQWAARILGGVDGALRVLPTFEASPAYAERLRGNTAFGACAVGAEELSLELRRAEPAECLVIVDPACWPLEGFDLESVLSPHPHFRGATHAVAIGADTERTQERVDCDHDGRVKRVERLYSRVSWPEAAEGGLFLTVAPARTVADVRFETLPELRSALAARGVLSRDQPIASDVVNLTESAGLLAVTERMLTNTRDTDPRLGFTVRAPGILEGLDANIAETARLIAPVIVFPGAVVEEDVRVIGPAVLGAGSRVGRGAVVAQSVLAPGAVVTRGATIRHCMAAGVCSANPTHPSSAVFVPMTPIGGYAPTESGSLVRGEGAGRRQAVHQAAKRAMDVMLSLLALVVLAPVFLVVAIALRLDSPGPLFFRHRRERKGGRDFWCLKFRTMVADADRMQRGLSEQNEVDGPQFKIDNDPRVTRVGRFLRATNLDELPQLLNVLLGQMSLVGPRPSPFRENQICVPWRRARLSVRPGITGLWQVCRGNRGQSDFNQWIYYDITYVRHFSIWLDLKILLTTLLTLGGKWSVPLSWIIPSRNRIAEAGVAAMPS